MNQAERIEKLKANKAEISRLEDALDAARASLEKAVEEQAELRKGCTHETSSGQTACVSNGFAGVDCMICLENF